MSIQQEIHKAMKDIQAKLNEKQELDHAEVEKLLLAALIEEEA